MSLEHIHLKIKLSTNIDVNQGDDMRKHALSDAQQFISNMQKYVASLVKTGLLRTEHIHTYFPNIHHPEDKTEIERRIDELLSYQAGFQQLRQAESSNESIDFEVIQNFITEANNLIRDLAQGLNNVNHPADNYTTAPLLSNLLKDEWGQKITQSTSFATKQSTPLVASKNSANKNNPGRTYGSKG